MLKGKSLLYSTNVFSPNEYEKNDKIVKRIRNYVLKFSLFAYFFDITKFAGFHLKIFDTSRTVRYIRLWLWLPSRIRLDKVTGFIRIYHGARYLISLNPKTYETVLNRIR